MRSRDGNHPFSFTVLIILFLAIVPSFASEYLISYRYAVKDGYLLNHSLQLSRAMKKCTGAENASFELEHKNNKNLSKLLSLYEEDFIDFLHTLDLHVDHKSITKNMQNSSMTTLTLQTTCFKVEFNDNFAIITAIK